MRVCARGAPRTRPLLGSQGMEGRCPVVRNRGGNGLLPSSTASPLSLWSSPLPGWVLRPDTADLLLAPRGPLEPPASSLSGMQACPGSSVSRVWVPAGAGVGLPLGRRGVPRWTRPRTPVSMATWPALGPSSVRPALVLLSPRGHRARNVPVCTALLCGSPPVLCTDGPQETFAGRGNERLN